MSENYENARTELDSEFAEFDADPVAYIEAMGWNLKRYPRIRELRDQLSFTRQEVEALARKMDEAPSAETALDLVSDYRVNLVAGKIQDEYPKL